jgi:hypothetical protein
VLIINFSTFSRAQTNVCDGNYGQLVPNPNGQCYSYIHCVLSSPIPYDCPIGHIFDPINRECVLGDRKNCQIHNFTAMCEGIFFKALPYPDDHNDKLYVGCIKEEPTVFSCLENETFNVGEGVCSETTDINVCDGNFGQLVPNPDGQCYSYIHCVLSSPIPYDCPIGHIFDPKNRECVLGDRKNCQVHDFEAICEGIFFKALPYPDDHNDKLYVGCIKEEPTVFSCLKDETFNLEDRICAHLNEITTTEQTTISTSDPTTSTSEPTTSTSDPTTSTSEPTTSSSEPTTSTSEPTTSASEPTTSTSEPTTSTSDPTTSTSEPTTSSSEPTTSTSEPTTSASEPTTSTSEPTTSTSEPTTSSSEPTTSTSEPTTSTSEPTTSTSEPTTSTLPADSNPCAGIQNGK